MAYRFHLSPNVLPARKPTLVALLLGLSILLSLSNLSAQDRKPAVQWWQSLYQKGLNFVKENQLDAAEDQFRAILARDRKVPQAHYGLGLVANKEEPGSSTAESHFKKAIDLDDDYAEAFYQLAMVYKKMRNKLFECRRNLQIAVQKDPHLADAWFELSKVQEELWPYEDVVNLYSNGVKHAPEARVLYAHFINTALWFHKEKKALSTLEYLIKKYPEEPEYLFGLAEIHYAMDEFQKSQDILDTLRVRFPDFSLSRRNLLRAKILFDSDSTTEALAYYISAINTIRDSTDARAIFKDACYLMRDREYDELKVTPLDKIWNFYHRFWRSRDPNLATRENERIVEHYKRLSYARKNYRRYLPGYDKSMITYASVHPYSSLNIHGEKLLRETHLPKALQTGRELDDLGLIYVRHGEPDQKVSSFDGLPRYVDASRVQRVITEKIQDTKAFSDVYLFRASRSTLMVPRPTNGENLFSLAYLDNLPMNVSWKYRARVHRPEMIFHFKKFEGNTGWIIEAIPYAVAERDVFDVKYRQLGRESFSPRPNGPTVSKICDELVAENKIFITIGMQTESSDYRYTEAPLQVPSRLIAFKGENGQDLVELYYGINGKEIALDTTGSQNLLKLKRFVGFYDESWNEVVRIDKYDSMRVNVTPEQWNKSALLEVQRFSVPTGRYFYEIQFKDMTGNKLAVYRGGYASRDFSQDKLMFSDFLLPGPIGLPERNSRFKKEGVSFEPHMFEDYKPGETVGLYFELYNLALDDEDMTNFRITCTLRTFGTDEPSVADNVLGFFRSLTGEEQGRVGTSYVYNGHTRDEKIYLNFNVGDRGPGKYELVITARDLIADAETSGTIELRIR